MSLTESHVEAVRSGRHWPAESKEQSDPRLPPPLVVRCGCDPAFDACPAVMELRWDSGSPASARRTWSLPGGISLCSSPPERFGITVQRREADSYYVDLLWNHTFLCWASLTRSQLAGSALLPLLQAMGTDLWELLDQPVEPRALRRPK
jgi:hypothetical protein